MGDQDTSHAPVAAPAGGSGAAAPGTGEAEEYFEAVVRGSAEELLDAGAHTEIDAMRHSAAHVMAEAVVGIFPDAQLGIGPSIDDGFYYDFLLPRPLTPDDLAAIESGMRASIAADHPFVRDEVPFERGPSLLRGAPAAVQGGDPRRPGDPGQGVRRSRCRRRPPTSTARSSTCARVPTSPAPARSGRSS